VHRTDTGHRPERDPSGRSSRLSTTIATRGALLAAIAALCALNSADAGAALPITVTYAPTGAEQTFVVPAAVFSVHLLAVGGKGGNGEPGLTGALGGAGASVSGELAVQPGEVLYLEVAGDGADAGVLAGGGAGGWGGGGEGGKHGEYLAGGGGGASDVRTLPRAQAASLESRLLVAGGGGGGAGGSNDGTTGAGGPAEAAGRNGSGGAGGGGAGAAGNGGTPGNCNQCEPLEAPRAGGLASGGAGGSVPLGGAGGGGGAGLYGGAGGGAREEGTGGGGGGGSSYTGPTVTAPVTAAVTNIGPSVQITYLPRPTIEIGASLLTFAPLDPGGVSESQPVTIANHGSAPLDVSGVGIEQLDHEDFAIENGCSTAVPVGSSCRVLVHFTPKGIGRRGSSLVIESDAAGSPGVVGLIGTGGASAPILSALKLSTARFRAGSRGGAFAAAAGTAGGGVAARGGVEARGAATGKRHRKHKRPLAPIGATVRYSDSLRSMTMFEVLKLAPGVRSGARCVAPAGSSHGAVHVPAASRCTRHTEIGSFEVTDRAGANVRRFTGRVEQRALRPGLYEIVAIARSGAFESAPRTALFRIVSAR
jgi:hypothetical protein